jgi:hypothetical protein
MEYSIGNSKIGKDTLIFNMTSATNCPSKKLGLCKHPNKCYAMKAERMYKQVLPFRERQAHYWESNNVDTIFNDLLNALNKHKNVKYIRFSESGDFTTQADVDKLLTICFMLYRERPDIVVYGYTARKDLDFTGRERNLVIQGSGFKIDNEFIAVGEYSEGSIQCKGSCASCSLCKEKGNRTIEVMYH